MKEGERCEWLPRDQLTSSTATPLSRSSDAVASSSTSSAGFAKMARAMAAHCRSLPSRQEMPSRVVALHQPARR